MGEIAGWVALVMAIALGVGLAMQTTRLGKLERQYRSLMKGAGPSSLSLSLGDLVANQSERLESARGDLEKLKGAVSALEAPVARSVQHVGLVRYNPFGDTGGDQSFAVALLDGSGNGVVMSSLHGRTATRFYAKPVKGGAPQASLSEEETQAIQQAMGRVVSG